MEYFYPLLISFILVFFSELGDKTQLLVLSFSAKTKTFTILLGVALGSFLSHGIAILFGSVLGNAQNVVLQFMLQLITYFSFILLGCFTLFKKEKEKEENNSTVKKISKLGLNYIFIIALTIAIGEIGDKTFLASIGLGIGYPNYKISLIIGAILGMVISDCLAIFLGKFLSKKVSEKTIQRLSGLLFLLFGFIGLISIFH